MKPMPGLLSLAALALTAAAGVVSAGTVKGHVFGANGRPAAAADVHLYPAGGSIGMQPLKSVPVERDGSFTLNIPDGRFFTLVATAVDHQFASVILPAPEKDETIGLEIALPYLKYSHTIDVVKIVGSWNDFNFGTAAEMTRLPNGNYVYEVEVPGKEEVSYQLLGVVGEANARFGRSVNAPRAASYTYDGGGDYRTVVPVKDSRARITFSPAALPRGGTATAQFAYDQKHDWINRIVAFDEAQYRMGVESAELQIALEVHMSRAIGTKAPLDTAALHKLVEQFRPRFVEAMRPIHDGLNDPHPTVRMFAAIKLAEQPELDPALVDQITTILPVKDTLWSINSGAQRRLRTWIKRLETNSVRELQEHAWRTTSFRSLVRACMEEASWGDPEKLERAETMVGKLIETFPNEIVAVENGDVSYVVRALNPNRAIKVGKQIPDFQVTLMDGGTASRASLIGKTYMIDFWAVWCGPCRAELPGLHAAYDKYKSRGLSILSLSFDQKPADVTKFRQRPETPMPWMHSFIEGNFSSPLAKAFEVEGIPKPILVGPDGTIIAEGSFLRDTELPKTLERHLPEDHAGAR